MCVVANAVLGTMIGLGMRGLDSSANAEIVEVSLPFRALPPNQNTGPDAGRRRQPPVRTLLAARVGQLCRSAKVATAIV